MNTEIITQTLGEAKLWAINNSPKILLFAGIAAGVGAVAAAIVATTKAIPVAADAMQEIDRLKNGAEVVENTDEETGDSANEIVPVDNSKEITNVRLHAIGRFIKIYALTIVLVGTSIGCILASNHIMVGRNIALSSAYAGIAETFGNYRERVKDRYGEDVEQDIYYNRETVQTGEISSTDLETGETTTEPVEKKLETKDTGKVNNNLYLFGAETACGKHNSNYSGNYACDVTFLRGQELAANDKLRGRGYLFLNDVLRSLGLDTVKEGQVLGWTYDPEDRNCQCHIDFGLDRFEKSDYVSHEEFWLNIVPDGDILNRVYANKNGRYDL